MKKILFLMVLFCKMTLIGSAQNVGIGTTTPAARLHVTDSSVVFSANGIAGSEHLPPISGEGRRMMWYPARAAFRTGYVAGDNWNKDSIGSFSFASGYNTKAKGPSSTAIGFQTTASNYYSIAMGYLTTASGEQSTAMGAFGNALGDNSTAMGNTTNASGNAATSMGHLTIASGISATASGGSTTASGSFSFSAGEQTFAKARGTFTAGLWNDDSDNPDNNTPASTDRIFQIGNGNSVTRSNAMTVLANGKVGIGTTSPNATLEAKSNITGVPILRLSGVNEAYQDFYPLGNAGGRYGWLGYSASNPDKLFIYNDRPGDISFITGGGERLTLKANGNVGIGTANPQIAGLVVDKTVGGTNAVFGSNTAGVAIESTIPGIGFNTYEDGLGRKTIATGYGGYIGVNPFAGEMIFSITNASYPAGSNVSSNLGLSITSNGNTGVGVTADPNYKMVVGGRMRIRSGGNVNNTAGVWLNNTDNSGLAAFMGMQSNNQIGFFGNTSNWGFVMNTTTGNIGMGTTTPTAKLEVNGFTKLGSDAPAIKTKLITGTTGSTQGGFAFIEHGLPDFSKILSISVIVFTPFIVHHSTTDSPGEEFHYTVDSIKILISNALLNSAGILSKPVKILITYEE
jgi:hypothetical protein